jgi:hypothetical protein
MMMAEIRCPMCGKPNPSDRDTCQYCQARLKSMADLHFTAREETIPESNPPEDQVKGEKSLPDWLKSIRNTDFLGPPPDDSEPIPAWITGEDGSSFDEEDQTEKIEVPDWLSNLRQEGEKIHTSALSEEKLNKLPIDDEPEWLRKIRLGQKAEDVFPDRGKEPLREQLIFSAAESPTQNETEEESSSEIPNWVAELSGKTTVTNEPPPEKVEKESLVEEPRIEQKEEGSLLAWLSTLEEDKTTQEAPVEIPITEIAEEPEPVNDEALFSSELSGLFDEADTFDFDLEEATPSVSAVSQEAPPSDQSQKTISPFTFEEEIEEAEVPDWLGGISISDITEPEGEPKVEAEAEITPSTVPNWLEAYKPVETKEPPPAVATPIIPTGKKLEGAGPLAGLYSVLPAEPDIAKSRKPSIITDELQITEKQRHQTSVFEELLSSEGIPGLVAEKPIIASQNVFRIAIFLILCFAILGAILSGINLGALPTPPAETLDVINTLNSISKGAPVLLAVDYQPGYTGEMEAGTSVLLDHLMVKGASLAMVSTNPTGPAQIERLISQVNKNKGHQYKAKEQYITLGYIPGGIAGLNGFAIQPRRIFNLGSDGKPIWGSSWLNSINKISDFSLVIIATDDPDTARAWIEQVQPYLENKPMLMVVSAQAEAMVRPYYETSPKQVSGMVAGLMGGAAYEQIINRPGVAIKYWSPFNAAIIMAIFVIVIGSIYTISMTLYRQRKENAQEGRG